ncbi:MAG: hypothetical protein Q7S45_01100 [Candidatus Curtissbacteria bacterium]|nr:hypothetical protein [Candidatus Curtissbacteria bacterium]
MLDRLVSLVPFVGIESKGGKENLQKLMVNKAMELALVGGYRFHEPFDTDTLPHAPYDVEWLKVHSRAPQGKFKVYINRDSFNTDSPISHIDRYMCRVFWNKPDGSRGVFCLEYDLADGAEYHSSFSPSAGLGKRQWGKVLGSFLSSELDEDATRKGYESDAELYKKKILEGRAVVEWVSDMQSPQETIAGFLSRG